MGYTIEQVQKELSERSGVSLSRLQCGALTAEDWDAIAIAAKLMIEEENEKKGRAVNATPYIR